MVSLRFPPPPSSRRRNNNSNATNNNTCDVERLKYLYGSLLAHVDAASQVDLRSRERKPAPSFWNAVEEKWQTWSVSAATAFRFEPQQKQLTQQQQQQQQHQNKQLTKDNGRIYRMKSPRANTTQKSVQEEEKKEESEFFNCENDNSEKRKEMQRQQDLIAAFQLLQAHKLQTSSSMVVTRKDTNDNNDATQRSSHHHHIHNQNIHSTSTDKAIAIHRSKFLEKKVSNCIARIGEVVIHAAAATVVSSTNDGGNKSNYYSNVMRSDDDAFCYFCEKNILSLLVDIVKETPTASTYCPEPSLHGVVWSPVVKAQVLHTIASLIASVRDPRALYYILSQNCLNELLLAMHPLHQWTDPALEHMLHVYVGLLKQLVLHLRSSTPALFALYCNCQNNDNNNDDDTSADFPLFRGILETATSQQIATSDSFAHLTCLSLIIDMLQITYAPMQEWILRSEPEQQLLADHICGTMILGRFSKLCQLATGPVVDGIRADAIAGQLQGLGEELDLMHDIFECGGIPCLHVRLCECFLQTVVRKLLVRLLPADGRETFLSVGTLDTDVIPDAEARAQAATLVLHKLLERIHYAPLVRMIVVAVWHEQSTALWYDDDDDDDGEEVEEEDGRPRNKYTLTPALHAIASSSVETKSGTPGLIDNPFRKILLEALGGKLGPWRQSAVAMLLERTLQVTDTDTLQILSLISPLGSAVEATSKNSSNVVETIVVGFLTQEHVLVSTMTSVAIERMLSLSIGTLSLLAKHSGHHWEEGAIAHSQLWRALPNTRDFFCSQALQCRSLFGVDDLFVGMFQEAVETRYRRRTNIFIEGTERSRIQYAFSLLDYRGSLPISEILVRKLRGVAPNEVESTRFHIEFALYTRAVCRCVERYLTHIETGGTKPSHGGLPVPEFVDPAGTLSSVFGSLRENPPIGSEMDLRGRMAFRFTLGDDAGDDSILILVLDTEDLYVVRPQSSKDAMRGRTLCSIPLLSVIASADDSRWLHVAVKHENVNNLIKNGNMAFCFDSPATCIIVWRYLDRSRNAVRREIMGKVQELFLPSVEPSQEVPESEIPQ